MTTKKGTVNVQLHTQEPKSPNKNPFPNKGRIKAQNSRKALEDFITWTCHPQEWSHMTVTGSTKSPKMSLKILSDTNKIYKRK